MFMYDPPRFGFARSQQRLLIAALHGGTDEDLAEELGISVSAVKKAWQSIYAKAEAAGVEAWTNRDSDERGKERKRDLLDYVRTHREELRPADLKLVKGIIEKSSSGQTKAVMPIATD